MGQKTNINSLRNFINASETQNTGKQTFINNSILTYLKHILKKRGVLVVQASINKIQNKTYVEIVLFFTKKKLNQYKKRKKTKKYFKNITFFKRIISTLKINLIYLKITNINKNLNKILLVYFFKNLKKQSKLFDKHQNFFLDFVKIVTLFCQEKIKTEFFLIIIGTLFSFLKKKDHTKYFRFLDLLYQKLIIKNQNILGIKTVLCGKILGKAIASSKIMLNGSMPIQAIGKQIMFEKLHVYTIYGVFGLKLWVHKKTCT